MTYDGSANGSFTLTQGQAKQTTGNGSPWEYSYVQFNSSKSSAVYGKSSVVTPLSQKVIYLIHY